MVVSYLLSSAIILSLFFQCVSFGSFDTTTEEMHRIRQKRIMGGSVAETPERWAFAPSLKSLTKGHEEVFQFQCGSTIISKRHLLTAAHCIHDLLNLAGIEDDPVKRVLFHDFFLADLRLINDVIDMSHVNSTSRVHVHQHYNYNKINNDIAIVEYPEGFDFGIEPIRLAADFVENDGEMAFAVGYGRFAEPGEGKFYYDGSKLREAAFVFRSPEFCAKSWAKPDTKKKICAGEFGRGTSTGDSGGPIMKNGDDGKWYQVGITSYGRRFVTRDRKTFPGINTRVSYYCPWINQVTNGEVKCVPYERKTKVNAAEKNVVGNVVEEVILEDINAPKTTISPPPTSTTTTPPPPTTTTARTPTPSSSTQIPSATTQTPKSHAQSAAVSMFILFLTGLVLIM